MTDAIESEKDSLFLKFVCQHLGCLSVTVVALDKSGKDVGNQFSETYSGFFIELNKHWFFVTAGHVFKHTDPDGNRVGLEERANRKAIRIVGASIIDYIGIRAKIYHPTIIDYPAVLENTVFINEAELGLDFALLPLRDWYVTSIAGNGVIPFVEHTWLYEGEGQFHAVVGFPDEEKKPPPSANSAIGGWIKPMLFIVEKCDLPSEIPTPTYPYFAARLPESKPCRAAGISGSPIIAFKRIGNDTRYFLTAIDVSWYPEQRIIIGCPMRYVVGSFLNLLAQFSSQAIPPNS
jgi:hypothetical protein